MRWRDEILLYQRDSVKAKAAFYVKTDVEGRRHREQKGLETQVVFAVNAERYRLEFDKGVFVSKRTSLDLLVYK